MVFEKVREILAAHFDMEESEITLETLLDEDLGADSLDLVDLIMDIEDEFNVEVPEDNTENLTKVADLVNYIENLLK